MLRTWAPAKGTSPSNSPASSHRLATCSEIDLENLTAIRRAVVEAGLQNVTVVKAEEAATGLPEACCDAAFLRGVYHHLTEPTATAAGLFMALRPSGHLAIIDFLPSRWLSIFFPTTGVPSNRGGHGIQPEIVIEELTAAGFALDRRIDAWRGGNYCLVRPFTIQSGIVDGQGVSVLTRVRPRVAFPETPKYSGGDQWPDTGH